MARTSDVKIIRDGTPGNSTQPVDQPMGAGALTLYRGTFALTDSNGFLKDPDSPAITDTCWGLISGAGPGVADTGPGVTNASGAASGAAHCAIETGTFWMAQSTGNDAITQTQVGKNVFVFDGATVAATNNSGARPVAGVCIAASDPLNVLSGLVAVKLGSNQSSGAPS